MVTACSTSSLLRNKAVCAHHATQGCQTTGRAPGSRDRPASSRVRSRAGGCPAWSTLQSGVHVTGGRGRGQECVGQPWLSPCSVSSSALWDGGHTLLLLWPRDAGGGLGAVLEKPGPLVEACPQLQPCHSCHCIKRCLWGKGQWLCCFCSFRLLRLGAAHLGTSQTGGQ